MPNHLSLRSILPALAVAALLTIPCAASAQIFKFASPRNSDVGSSPVRIAAGDLDHDNHDDVVVANDSAQNDVSVLLGDGLGNFAPAMSVVVGTGFNAPISVALGDFDEDGNPDLAVGKKGFSNLAILPGDGSGGFGSPANRALENSIPESLTAAYIDDDPHLDLVFANRGTGTAGVLLGIGDGTFGELASYPVTAPADPLPGFSQPISVAVGDFSEDQKLDLAVTLRQRQHVAVLLGDGLGSFAAPIILPILTGLPDDPTTVTTDDFDDDGLLDLAVIHSTSARVSVLSGDGTGNFVLTQTLPGIGRLGGGNSADFNDDSRLDLTWVSGGTIGRVFVAPGLGSGLFGPPEFFSLAPDGENSWFSVAGDFNEDGAADIIVANKGSDNVSLLLNSVFNACPVADAGENQRALIGETIFLDGSGSSDPDGDLLDFSWALLSQPAGSAAVLVGEITEAPSVVPDLQGNYEIELVVDDGTCNSPPSTVTVMTLTVEEIIDEILLAVDSLDDSDFKKGGFNSFDRVFGDVTHLISNGNLEAAIKKAKDLLKHLDGCIDAAGTANNNDWIVDCTAQLEVRRLVEGLVRTLQLVNAG